MFNTILIANRGEIACRVIQTARRMGIRTVAVHSDADAASLHVALADTAIRIGPAPASESYLRADAILEAARQTGAQAIHPGYGFLSENADFAEACAAASITFIGPPAAAIRAMGGKSQSKALMAAAGVPLVPGYHGEAQDLATMQAAADAIGYPVLIKASAGGGGKGMRVVTTAADFPEALAAAQREGASSFGDSRVLLEKYLQRPRHVEVQIFADQSGHTLYLFDRDCSIQRRHQKVIEEAPAPNLSPALRQAMGEAAVAAARAVNYVGAGTVEFILECDDRRGIPRSSESHDPATIDTFAFMEMNTRLQVEHPVTEAITGLDLVEWQLRVAAGEPLPWTQSSLRATGHAIEARLYAEDPTEDFRPSTGQLTHLRLPATVRVDAGVREGDTITANYDPMIAKLIAHGETRAEAIFRLAAALGQTEVAGPRTNLAFLHALATHLAFQAAELDTSFIPRHAETLFAPPSLTPPIIAAAALAALPTASGPDPWSAADGWRLNLPAVQTILLRQADRQITIRATPGALEWDNTTHTAHLTPTHITCDGTTTPIGLHKTATSITVFANANDTSFDIVDPLAPPAAEAAGAGRLASPIPGRVVSVLVALGDAVKKGQPLVVLEAMKMELTLRAALDATVAEVRCTVGEMVPEGVELVLLSEA